MADDKKPPPGPPKPLNSQRPTAAGPKPVARPAMAGPGGPKPPPAAPAKPIGPRVPAAAPRPPAKPVTQPRVPAAKPPVTQAKTPVNGGPAQPAPPPRPTGPLDLEQIYFVESDHDPTALLARRAGIDDGWLHWDDTNRDRVHRVGDVKQDGELITVQTDRGLVYRFQPLTKEIYDEKVREKVELSPSFGSTEELREFYRTAVM